MCENKPQGSYVTCQQDGSSCAHKWRSSTKEKGCLGLHKKSFKKLGGDASGIGGTKGVMVGQLVR